MPQEITDTSQMVVFEEIQKKVLNLMIEIKDTVEPDAPEIKSIMMWLTNVSKEVNLLTIKGITANMNLESVSD